MTSPYKFTVLYSNITKTGRNTKKINSETNKRKLKGSFYKYRYSIFKPAFKGQSFVRVEEFLTIT